MHTRRKSSWFTLALALIFISGVTFVVLKFVRQARVANDELIAEHIQKLQGIFKTINDTCKITGFRNKKDSIDFLNVISFAGSVVGPMGLEEPKNWKGPYLPENLSIDGKDYQIVVTKKGDFIVPGDGVKLSNGKVIGKTLMLTPESDIPALMADKNGLLSQGKPLAARIETVQSLLERASKVDLGNDSAPIY
jgi:hypothetical protein